MSRVIRGMVYLTEHSKLRFVQRVLGMEDEEIAKKYVEENDLQVSSELWKSFSYSQLFFDNFTFKEGKDITGSIYIYQDIIFIVSIKSELITLWRIKHDAPPEKFPIITEAIKSKINFNKVEISKLDTKKLKLGQEGRKIEFAINKFQEFLLQVKNAGDQNAIYLIEEQIKQLQDDFEKTVEEGKNVSVNVKNLKKENRRVMKNLMYGFIE